MGLGDQVSRILIDVKAETKSARNALTELNSAIEVVGKGYQFAREAMDEYDEHLRLTTATANVNIASLSKAFRGLVTEHELLSFAAKTQTGILALNQQEMEKVAQAALALRNRGFDAEEALRKLTDAAVKGKVGGLDDLGLSIKEGASRAETLKNMMTELDGVIRDSGDGYNQAAEDVKRLGVEWDNATAAAKRYSVEALKAIDFDKIGELKKLMAAGLSPEEAMGELTSRDSARADLAAQQAKDRAAAQLARRKADMGVIEMADDFVGRRPGSESVGSSNFFGGIQSSIRVGMSEAIAVLNGGIGAAAGKAGEIADAGAFRLRNPYDEHADFNRGLEDFKTQAEELQRLVDEATTKRQQTYLESIFGTPDDINLLVESFNAFTGAVGASYEAIVTGSGSAGAAFKKMIADSLMALGKRSAIESIKELAYAAGSFAFGDAAGAALHLQSAGLHAAVAVGAGLASNAMQPQPAAGGGAASAGTQGGGSRAGGSQATSSGPDKSRPVVVVLGSSFDETTPRQRARTAQAAIDKAIRERDE